MPEARSKLRVPTTCKVGEGREVHYRSRRYAGETECGMGGAFGGPLYDVPGPATCESCVYAVHGRPAA